jgi:hypothetical protein
MAPEISVGIQNAWYDLRMKALSSFFVMWLALTAAYLAMFFSGVTFGPLVAVVGMFVPYGAFNLIATFAAVADGMMLPIVAFVGFLIILCTADILLKRAGVQPGPMKIVINLVILLVATALVDLSIWGAWASLGLLTDGDVGGFGM